MNRRDFTKAMMAGVSYLLTSAFSYVTAQENRNANLSSTQFDDLLKKSSNKLFAKLNASPQRLLNTLQEPLGPAIDDTIPYESYQEEVVAVGSMNFQGEADLFKATLIGKRIIISERGNLFNQLNDRKDLKDLFIFAEHLTISTKLRLFQTNIHLFCRNIVFVNGGHIDTSPLDLEVSLDASGKPMNGLKAGDIRAFVSTISCSGNSKCFLANGGSGQNPAPGKAAQAGSSMQPLPTQNLGGAIFVNHGNSSAGGCSVPPPQPDPNYGNEIVFYHSQVGSSGNVVDAGTSSWPSDGLNGVAASPPGEGGAGGNFSSNVPIDVSSIENVGGPAGKPFKDDPTPGAPGSPNPAYHLFCLGGMRPPPDGGNWVDKHVGVSGIPAVSPQAQHLTGTSGNIDRVGDQWSWISVESISRVIDYVEDLFISRFYKEAAIIVDDYVKMFNEIQISVDDHERLNNFVEIIQRLEKIQIQLKLGLDYYGQAKAWVPLLSFEVYESAYQADLTRASDAIYLASWFKQVMSQAIQKSGALNKAIAHTNQELAANQIVIRDLRDKVLPKLSDDVDEIGRQQSLLASKMTIREQQLRNIAKDTAADAERKSEEAAGLRTMGAIISLVPVAQPIGVIVGAGLKALADKEDVWNTAQSIGSSYLKGKDYIDKCAKLTSTLDQIDFTNIDSLEKSILNHKDDLIDYLSSLHDLAATELADKGKDSVSLETADQILSSLLTSDPTYKELCAEAEEFLKRKKNIFEKIVESRVQIAQSIESVHRLFNLSAASARDLRSTEKSINLDTLRYVMDVKRKAIQRLRYYNYTLARAYEYRLLEKYDLSIVVDLDYSDLEKIANAGNSSLTASQVKSLMTPYEQQLSILTSNIIHRFSSKPGELQITRKVRLHSAELKILAQHQELYINFAQRTEMAGFPETNRRIISIEASEIELTGADLTIDIVLVHGGVSIVESSKQFFAFRHLGYDGGPFLTWKSNKDTISGAINSAHPSKDAESLLLSRFGAQQNKLSLFAAPALDASVKISIAPASFSSSIDAVTFDISYSFDP